MKITCKSFEALGVHELYELLALRTDVFVVEQKCAYAELDHHDQLSIHVLGWQKGELVGCARIAPPGSVYKQASIGRVAVQEVFRGRGLGHQVFHAALTQAREQYEGEVLRLQAQVYLEKFYAGYGFRTISDPYPDFGVWHVDMEKELT